MPDGDELPAPDWGILAKGLSRETISNPQRFLAFTSGVARHVTVDNGLTTKAIGRIALSLRLGPGDVISLQAPIAGFGETRNEQSIDIVDTKRLRSMASALRQASLAGWVVEPR